MEGVSAGDAFSLVCLGMLYFLFHLWRYFGVYRSLGWQSFSFDTLEVISPPSGLLGFVEKSVAALWGPLYAVGRFCLAAFGVLCLGFQQLDHVSKWGSLWVYLRVCWASQNLLSSDCCFPLSCEFCGECFVCSAHRPLLPWPVSLEDTHSVWGVGAWRSVFEATPLLVFMWPVQLAWSPGGAQREAFAGVAELCLRRGGPRCTWAGSPAVRCRVWLLGLSLTWPCLRLRTWSHPWRVGSPEAGGALGLRPLTDPGLPVLCQNTYFVFWLLVSLCKLSLSLSHWWDCKLFEAGTVGFLGFPIP